MGSESKNPLTKDEIERLDKESNVRLKCLVIKFCLIAISIVGLSAITIIVLSALSVLEVDIKIQAGLVAASLTPIALVFRMAVRAVFWNRLP